MNKWPEWQPIETAPKSLVPEHVEAILGYCPEEGINPTDSIWVIWWEPYDRAWVGQGAGAEPTHWMPLPDPPKDTE